MGNWRTVGVRLKEEQLAQLNLQLQKLGYATLGELVGGHCQGELVVEPVAFASLASVSERRFRMSFSLLL